MTAQAQSIYEIEECDNLEKAKELQRQGHTLACSAAMEWTGAECSCKMEG